MISKEDLEEFIPSEDVDDAYDMLDEDGDGKVTADDCVSAVQNIYQQRANLAASLKDSRSIASSLEVMIGIIVHLIFVMIYFYILFAVTFNQIWAFVSTVVLGLSFIFGQYIRMIFENTMFLFNSHPFDIGDMLFMDNDFLVVDEIQINFTICINSSRQRIWIPNQRLVTNPFINLTTSGNRTENIIILVDIETPPHVLDDIIAAMEALKEEMPQEYSAVGGSFRDCAVPMKMTMKLFYDFTHNGTNLARCTRARSRMYICVAAAMQKAGVAYTWPAMRTLNHAGAAAAGAAVAAVGDPNTAPVVGVL
jgi:small-conductance mechanosensitive channel